MEVGGESWFELGFAEEARATKSKRKQRSSQPKLASAPGSSNSRRD